MKNILREVHSGDFAREWVEENERGRVRMEELMKREADHPMEEVGSRLRERMFPANQVKKNKDRD